MKKAILSIVILVFTLGGLKAQKYFTRDGYVSFTSEAPVERIEAQNNSATSVLDLASGKLEFAVLIKAFQFKKALMQEHFNENYMESNKYPKALFKGQIVNLSNIDFITDGTYTAEVTGDITIHGVTRNIEVTGEFVVKNGSISATSTFALTVADFDIEIPALVRDNIAKTVAVTLKANYQEFDK